MIGHEGAITSLKSFSNILASSSEDKSIKIWNASDCSVISKLERKQGGHSHAVNDICKLDEHTLCSVGDDKRIIIWDAFIES